MLEWFPIALMVGAVLGFLTGLGVGGGSLLILWLTLVLGIPQQDARSINLLFFLPAAILSSLFRFKQGTVKLRPLLPAIASGCAAAAVFSILGAGLDLEVMKKLFGVLLIVTGLRELMYRPK